MADHTGLVYTKISSIKTPKDMREISYLWKPKVKIDSVKFTIYQRQFSNFRCGYHGMFKPSIAEVLSQIPQKVLDIPLVNGFFIDTSIVYIYRSGEMQMCPVVYGIIEKE